MFKVIEDKKIIATLADYDTAVTAAVKRAVVAFSLVEVEDDAGRNVAILNPRGMHIVIDVKNGRL